MVNEKSDLAIARDAAILAKDDVEAKPKKAKVDLAESKELLKKVEEKLDKSEEGWFAEWQQF